MKQFSKEGKCGNIQSFFSLQSTREKSDKVSSSFTTTEQQQRQFVFYIRKDN
jgi:hypothetical protein